jgi:hypothetical protein
VCSALEAFAASLAVDEDPSRRHPHGGMVVADVTGDRHEFKVLKAVVSLDPVDVVNLLVSPEASSKMLAHDEAMLKDVEATARDLDVTVISDSAKRRATRSEAHPRPSGAPSVSHTRAASAWCTSLTKSNTTLKGF